MSTLINKAGQRLFAQHLERYTPKDPYYEDYTDDRGRKKRKKRSVPPGLSKRDARILRSVQRRAHHLDRGFSLCGLRFGYAFLIGLVPIIGDAADAILGYLLVTRKARQADIPSWLLRRMLLHSAVGTAVGAVPLVGDVLLAAYKPNSRNAALLEEFLRIRGEAWLSERKEASGPGAAEAALSERDRSEVRPGAGFVSGEMDSKTAPRKRSFGFLGRRRASHDSDTNTPGGN